GRRHARWHARPVGRARACVCKRCSSCDAQPVGRQPADGRAVLRVVRHERHTGRVPDEVRTGDRRPRVRPRRWHDDRFDHAWPGRNAAAVRPLRVGGPAAVMFIAGVTVTIIRGVPGFDAYGDPVGAPVDGWGDEVTFAGQPIRWSEPTLIDLPGVTLAPRVGGPGTASSDIEGRGREGGRVGFTMYAEVGAD